jgi:hypothetical protein
MQDLDCRGIRTKRQLGSNGQSRGGIRFGVGPLAHLLRNRFYVGEVVYRGKVHSGEHEPIVDQPLFEAVQTKLAASITARQLRLKGSPAILAGRIFDDRGNRMTPTHTNKRGARYRYYVSHALLQKQNEKAGSLTRVSAPEIESLVVDALNQKFGTNAQWASLGKRELIERQLDRVVVTTRAIEIHLAERTGGEEGVSMNKGGDCEVDDRAKTIITVPWSLRTFAGAKGILHSASPPQPMRLETREILLSAIAKARMWINELVEGYIGSFAEIAMREDRVERHIRLLVPLAFVSPRTISSIMDGTAPADMTVTRLVQLLAHSWIEQERLINPQSKSNRA